MSKTVRTRIAPSPTGIAHVGTAWMSLFDLALARQHQGKFVVRIEDTDRTRFVPEAEAKIYEAFEWLGIPYDEGGQKGGPFAPYHQSERLSLYRKYVDELLEKNLAYYCFATKEELDEMRQKQQAAGQLPKYDRRWRDADPAEVKRRLEAHESYVIRMKVPDDEVISWVDAIRGEISFSSNQVDDQVLLKSDGFPTYHLAVVVDDHLMDISHVLRGEEWISSTPKHLLLYRAFGWEPPVFAHMPLIRNADHSKLSKRKNDVSILSYRDKGFLPEALLNFLMLLGWSHPDKKEIFDLAEFMSKFSLERVQTTAPVFDLIKLQWMNGIYIRELSLPELSERLKPFLPADFPHDSLSEILPLVRERLVTLADMESLTSFMYREVTPTVQELQSSNQPEVVIEQLELVQAAIEAVGEWKAPALEQTIRELQEQHDWKKKQFFMLLRVATTGSKISPPLFETMIVLGKERCLSRLKQAVTVVKT